jgi:DNA-binding response OmpR family regulator
LSNVVTKIFVADDDSTILEVIRMILEIAGYTVTTTTNANDIFDYKQAELPALILLDLWMSGIDGKDICTRLKTNNQTKHIHVLFISANSNIKEITETYNADGFIAKPFEMDYLLKKVHDCLNEAASKHD